MGQWVVKTIYALLTRVEMHDEDGNQVDGTCLVSAIALLCIANETITFDQVSEKNCVEMSNLLRKSYKPNQRTKTCPAYDVLEQHLSTVDFR